MTVYSWPFELSFDELANLRSMVQTLDEETIILTALNIELKRGSCMLATLRKKHSAAFASAKSSRTPLKNVQAAGNEEGVAAVEKQR